MIGVHSNAYLSNNTQFFLNNLGFQYSYQKIFKNYNYENFSLHYTLLGDNKLLSHYSFQYFTGKYLNKVTKEQSATKIFVDSGLSFAFPNKQLMIHVLFRLGQLSRINSLYSQFWSAQIGIPTLKTSSNLKYLDYYFFQFMYGIHFFKGDGLDTEFKSSRLKKRKRGILKFL